MEAATAVERYTQGEVEPLLAPHMDQRFLPQSVAAYAAEVDFASGQLTQFRTNLPTLYAAYEGRIFSVYERDRPSKRRFEYDISTLAEDRVFVSDMVDAVRNQLQFLTIRENVLRRAQAMCETVSRSVGRTCDPEEISDEEIRLRDGVNR